MSNFDSTKTSLFDLLKEIVNGKVQLPDFQRGWVWDDFHVRSLLVSIARSFPVGAVMLLETGGDIRFQVRPVENVDFKGNTPTPERLILDGQQRLTSLTQVLFSSKPVKTFDEKGKPISRYYYIDINAALAGELTEENIIAVDSTRKLMTNFGRDILLDLSTPQLECENFYFPCEQIFNSDEWEEHLQIFAQEKFSKYMDFRKKFLSAFRGYQIPTITLKKETSKEAVCLVFEKVNTGGVPLSVFELVTASFAAEGYNLRDDWYGSTERAIKGREKNIKAENILRSVEPTDFLQAISLLYTHQKRLEDLKSGKSPKNSAAVSGKRVAILSLSLADYNYWADKVEAGFILAAKFLRKQCFYYSRDLPYRTQIIPLAAILATLNERWLEPKIYNKLSRWFWCGVFGELYGGAVETRIANDLEEMTTWINSELPDDIEDLINGLPRTITDASFQPNRLNSLRSRLSAAYKGLNVLVVRQGAKDFFWKASIQELDHEDVAIDIHHIFPKAWCQERKMPPSIYDSVINKTPISYKANRMIGKKSPATYLEAIQTHKQVEIGDSDMNDILKTHLINSETLRSDSFDEFYSSRRNSLIQLIYEAMGKEMEEIDDQEPSNENEFISESECEEEDYAA